MNRGIYETQVGRLLFHAHRAMETICMDAK